MSWLRKRTHVAPAAGRSRPAPLTVEQLETRTLLSVATLVVASGIVHSTESLADFVVSDYEIFLRRSPDLGGFLNWVGQLENGLAPEVFEADLVSSAEYIADHGNNAALWLTGLYNDLLGRAPDAAGFDFWLNELAAGLSPQAVAFYFATGAERQTLVITQDYLSFLGRVPSSAEINFWLSFEQQGHNREDVATQILGSDEFFADHADNPSTFIIGLYQTVLHRTPSTAEVDGWLTVYNDNL